MLRRMFMKPEFKYYKINPMSGTNVASIEPGKINYQMTNRKTNEIIEGSFECDAVVICTGITSRSSEDLKTKCEEAGIPVQVIGDALAARDAREATFEGYQAGISIE